MTRRTDVFRSDISLKGGPILIPKVVPKLRHLWQAARLMDKRRSKNLPLAFGARGKYSEVDTESYAIHMLRAWRRKALAAPTRSDVRVHLIAVPLASGYEKRTRPPKTF